MRRLFCAIVLAVLTAPALRAENGVRPGEFIVEPPTLICLGFEWEISGDDNRNATVDVSYRAPGDSRGATRCRCCAWAARRSSARPTPCPTGLPAASSISSPTPSMKCG